MNRLLLIVAAPLVAVAGCSPYAHHYSEEFSLYYDKPAGETQKERVDRKEIVHWAANPKDKKRIGFLYKYETKVKGSRVYRESYEITDRLGNSPIGFITAEGVFYRYAKDGRLGERVGEYTIITTGLKVFFGIPLKENVDLEEIDPYK